MKKCLGIISLLCVAPTAFGATIRVSNKTTKPLTVTAHLSSGKTIKYEIASMRNQGYNSWFQGIKRFEWRGPDTVLWKAPLSMRALQTEGRLEIRKNGQYIFKPCLPCKESRGTAQRISSAQPKAPEAPAVVPPPPVPTQETIRGRKRANLLKEIEKGQPALKKVKPNQPKVSAQEQLKKDIQSATLRPAEQRTLAPKPDTRSGRDRMLDDIKKGTTLRKTSPQARTKPQHEMQQHLEGALDKRQRYLEQLRRAQEIEAQEDADDAEWD